MEVESINQLKINIMNIIRVNVVGARTIVRECSNVSDFEDYAAKQRDRYGIKSMSRQNGYYRRSESVFFAGGYMYLLE